MLDGFSLAKLGPGWTSVTGRVFRVRGAVHAGSSGRWCWSGAVAGRAFPCLGWILGLACLSLLRRAISMPTLFLAVSLLLSSRARSKLLLLSQRRQLSRSHPTRTRIIVQSEREASKGRPFSSHHTSKPLHLTHKSSNPTTGQSPSANPVDYPPLNIAIPSINSISFPFGISPSDSISITRPPSSHIYAVLPPVT